MKIWNLLSRNIAVLSVLLSVTAPLFESCETWNPEELRRKTVLVYMSGDNDLWPSMSLNIKAMAAGMTPELSAYNSLIVFVDRPDANSLLLDVRNYMCDTVKIWNEHLSSSSPDVLSMVMDYVRKSYTAMSYGLVMSSHGTGWVPDSTLNYIDPYKYGLTLGKLNQMSATKAVCCKVTSAGKMRWMNVDRMAAAIPDGQFDFILFDACLMAGVETMCELYGKTEYVIGSSVEIMRSGFPYSDIMQELFSGSYADVCRKCYEYYDGKSGTERTCGVALINVDKIRALADAFRTVVDNATVDVDDIDLYHDVQRCDRYMNPVMFDLLDVAEKLKPGESALNALDRALSDCVSACYHTDYVVQNLKLDKYCGLNCYLPVSEYAYVINPAFAKTEWNRLTGFLRR